MSWIFIADDGERVHYEVPPKVAELEQANKMWRTDFAKLAAESAERMRRIEKLVALCHEYGIPMEKVLDTGLRESE